MSETRYIISDAAKMINVEPHVLRYWEEELGMDIPRNEMGHRYYTDKEVKIFSAVRDLKAKGFQLKAIKMVLSAISDKIPGSNIISIDEARRNIQSEEKTAEDNKMTDTSEEKNEETELKKNIVNHFKEIMKEDSNAQEAAVKAEETQKGHEIAAIERQEIERVEESSQMLTAEEKMKHFKYMMDGIMLQALQKNNQMLSKQLIEEISDRVIREMDDLFRIQEEREESRFRNLDEIIRNKQKGRKEAAAARSMGKAERRGLFGRQSGRFSADR